MLKRLPMSTKQDGVALIVVLLIVAMIAIIATNITSRSQLSVRRTINMVQYNQAYWYALSAEELSKKILTQDFEDDEDSINLQQYWAQSDMVFPVENGEIAGEISDMRSCFNLNSLSVSSEEDVSTGQSKTTLPMRQFSGLLVALGMDQFSADTLAATLKDYTDEDTTTSSYGAEDAEYESRSVPYRAANTLLFDKSELRAIMGFTQDIYMRIAPYVCAIPANDVQVLNVNTIKVEQAALLAGMFENKISVGEAEGIINQRPGDGFESIEDFWANSSISSFKTSDEALASSFGIKSDYFLLRAGAKVDRAIFRLKSVLMRSSDNKLSVISRQFGDRKIVLPVKEESSSFLSEEDKMGMSQQNSEKKK
ncbi:type II secretion system minor pseudopilin GspK [Shewanella surugensis]|uniref:Type II secretion system protein K n=1 Tax=Shewanella surugensis TaxID=212020 RepID=A0ABT0LA27_9GAMM|nr:type II secretion system minor pseudopilin GspK [Shewanella surugensis]MCL1124011.1 type II secretion system minor pseudopilin GspK [Shewanella surugensis]